jgi:hypothetical protein
MNRPRERGQRLSRSRLVLIAVDSVHAYGLVWVTASTCHVTSRASGAVDESLGQRTKDQDTTGRMMPLPSVDS